jgi:hypothetical protein
MEIFGGFMVMLSILGFFLAVLWFILPFVVFAMKGKLDRVCELLETVDLRLAGIEQRLAAIEHQRHPPEDADTETAPAANAPDAVTCCASDAADGE